MDHDHSGNTVMSTRQLANSHTASFISGYSIIFDSNGNTDNKREKSNSSCTVIKNWEKKMATCKQKHSKATQNTIQRKTETKKRKRHFKYVSQHSSNSLGKYPWQQM